MTNAINTTITTSIGSKVGAAIGTGAAYAVHGAARAVQSTGRFGHDVVAGTTEGYVIKNAELAAKREELRAVRQVPISISVKPRARKAVAA